MGRSTSFSCCKSLPCTVTNQNWTSPLKVCQGYDISGDRANNACPHQRGGCFADEDMHLDLCYKKCAILTNDVLLEDRGGYVLQVQGRRAVPRGQFLGDEQPVQRRRRRVREPQRV